MSTFKNEFVVYRKGKKKERQKSGLKDNRNVSVITPICEEDNLTEEERGLKMW